MVSSTKISFWDMEAGLKKGNIAISEEFHGLWVQRESIINHAQKMEVRK